MPEERIQIKRYPNRRFYDGNASKYISLEDIDKLVRSGRKVEIRESQSGKEITRSVLTRIILERQPDKMLLFPIDMLHFILRANDVSTGFLRDYFQHSLTYLDYLSRHSSASSTFARPMHWVKAWLDSMTSQQSEDGEHPSEEVEGAGEIDLGQSDEPETESKSEPEVEHKSEDKALRLARRVEQLERRIGQLESQED
ncbi:MAG: polyhydroxyalkanoate synthesis regulator DNA-binding domain-containing protein [Pirellulales bacterium]